jgi:hypothetical protein
MDNVDPDFVNLLDTQADQGHRIKIGGLGRMANPALERIWAFAAHFRIFPRCLWSL